MFFKNMKINCHSPYFKGWDAAPLKTIYIQKETAPQIKEELETMGRKENIEIKEITHPFKWMQDHQVILNGYSNPILLADRRIKKAGITEFKKENIETKKNKAYVTGGNSYIGKYPNGENWMILGKDEMLLHRRAPIGHEYDIKKENIFSIPQPEFHIDMAIRPIGYPNILVNDFTLGEDLLNEIDDGSKAYKEFEADFYHNWRIQDRHYSRFKEVEKALTKAGFNVIPIAGIFGFDINFMNGIVNQHPNGTISYITNSSHCKNKYSNLTQSFFEKALKEKAPNTREVYFIEGKEGINENQNYMMSTLGYSHGGIHCLSLEEPDFEKWDEIRNKNISFGGSFQIKDKKLKHAQKLFNQYNIEPKKFEIFEKFYSEHKKELNKEDIESLCYLNAIETFYSQEELQNAFLYFKNLNTKNKEMFCDIDYLLENINPGSEKASYIQTIIELIQSKDIPKNALSDLNSNNTISENLIKDLNLFYDVVAQNQDKNKLKDELLNAYIPTFKKEEEALKERNIGDAFKLKDEKFIRIKTDKNSSELMQISKETYSKLFPLFERFSSQQTEHIGNCYLLEPTMLLYELDNQRANLVKMFSESNNNIIVTLPNSKSVVFKNAEFPSKNSQFYVNGALGYRMLQWAIGEKKKNDIIADVKNILGNEERKESFQDYVNSNGNNIFIRGNGNTLTCTTFEKAKREGLIEKYNKYLYEPIYSESINIKKIDNFNTYLIANGGSPKETLEHYGYEAIDKSADEKDWLDFRIKTYNDFQDINFLKNKVIVLGFRNNDSYHCYGLAGQLNGNNTITYKLLNPYSHATQTEFRNLYEIEEIMGDLYEIVIAQKP